MSNDDDDKEDLRRELIEQLVAGIENRYVLEMVSEIHAEMQALSAFIDRHIGTEDPDVITTARRGLIHLGEYAQGLAAANLKRRQTRSRLSVLDGGKRQD